jgi:hypothetical protein
MQAQIDKNPYDDILKQAYTALVEGHVVIAGGIAQDRYIAAGNLYHYFYGDGATVTTLAPEYKADVISANGSLENYFSQQLSLGINLRERISFPTEVAGQNSGKLGVKKGFDAKANLENTHTVIWPQDIMDITLGLGRHTVTANLEVLEEQTLSDGEELDCLRGATEEISYAGLDYKTKRFWVRPSGSINIFDKYYFNNKSGNKHLTGGGLGTQSDELAHIMGVLKKIPNRNQLGFYMGKSTLKSLLDGEIDITDFGLSKLEELKLAKRFDVEMSFKDVGEFPIDIIERH